MTNDSRPASTYRLLSDEPFLQVPPALVRLIGLREAFVAAAVHWHRDRDSGWATLSGEQWCQVSALSTKQLKAAFNRLASLGLLDSEERSANKWDRTLSRRIDWRALDDLYRETAGQSSGTKRDHSGSPDRDHSGGAKRDHSGGAKRDHSSTQRNRENPREKPPAPADLDDPPDLPAPVVATPTGAAEAEPLVLVAPEPKQDPTGQAKAIVDEWWKEETLAGRPPTQVYIGIVKIVQRMLGNGVSADDIAYGLREALVPTAPAIGLAIGLRRKAEVAQSDESFWESREWMKNRTPVEEWQS